MPRSLPSDPSAEARGAKAEALAKEGRNSPNELKEGQNVRSANSLQKAWTKSASRTANFVRSERSIPTQDQHQPSWFFANELLDRPPNLQRRRSELKNRANELKA